jgi:hypothetical protein
MTDARENDPLYLELVRRVARGDPSPWRLDERYPKLGPPQARYRGGARDGDKQALLWEIYLAAEKDRPLEQWAATAFRELMLRVFGGRVENWDKEFGTPLAKKSLKKGSNTKGVYGHTQRKLADTMVPLWRYGQKLKRDGWSINDEFYEELGERFGIKSADDVKKRYWQPMQKFVRKYCPKYLKTGGGNFRPEMFRANVPPEKGRH